MYVYILMTIMSVVLACFIKNQYIDSKKGYFQILSITRQQMSNYCFLGVIAIIFIFVSAGRVAVGNDYWVYRDNFSLIAQGRHVSSEIGFNTIVWVLTKIFGQDNFYPIFAFFSMMTIGLFLRAIWNESRFFVGSIFLFLTGGYYFLSMNSIRYYLAMAICFVSIKYLFMKEYAKFFLIIIVAATFHKTVLIVIPVFLIAHYCANNKIPIWIYIVGIIGIISSILGREVYESIIYAIYPFYEGLASNNFGISYTNLLKCVPVLGIAFFFQQDVIRENVENKFYLYINIVAICIYIFGSFIPEASRLGYYFMGTQIFFLPNMLVSIGHKKWRYILIFFTGVCYIAYFILFLRQADQDGIRLLPYFNWILGD